MIKANTLSERLLVAQTEDAPKIIEQMHRYRYWVTPLMRQALAAAEEEGDLRKQLHASMALLPVDRVQIDYLFMRMLDARPDELPIIREAMLPYKDELQPKLWAAMERTDREHAHQRLRAAGALALYDLGEEKWSRVSDQVAADLVAVPAVYLATWVDSLRPAREMILPSLAAIYRDSKRREHERTMATDVLSDLAADKPILLAELLMDADEKQFNVLYPKLAAHGIMVLPSLDAEMTKRLPDSASNDSRELLARRQANAAVALMRLGYSTKVWPAFEHRPDPRLRTYLIHRLSACGVDPRQLVKRALDESVLSIRRALVLALGEYSKTDLPVVERELWLDHLRHAFQNESDAGLRSAAEWHLRQWNEGAWLNQAMSVFSRDAGFRDKKTEQVRRTVAAGQTGTQPQWYVNKVGDTMIVFAGPIEFRMGSPGDEAGREPGEALHGRRVERSFALASKPVSLAQFTRFQAKHDFPPHYAPTHDCPALRVSWYLAAEYCNWLSKQEGLPESEWCYLSNASGKYAEGMKLAPNYLQRTGYRLPTDAEWEYACRAGAITSRHYGCCEELLGKYAWYMNVSDHRSHPVGNLKPNDSGLFDILGNVYTWCQDRQKDFVVSDKPIVDVEEPVEVLDKDARILRGGSFADAPAVELRCAFRVAANPTLLNPYAGFRVARTFPTR
jgi:formylglycine-generating enzyme required for sulfatase activity